MVFARFFLLRLLTFLKIELIELSTPLLMNFMASSSLTESFELLLAM
jgi:hypothetical protein